MTMRTAGFTNGRIKLDTDTDQGKKEILTSVRQDHCVRFPSILSNIHNSPQQNFLNKVKTCSSSQTIVGRPGLSPGQRKGHEENWVTLGALSVPLAKQMGAEGSPVKKSLFGHTCHNHLGKMDPVTSNGSKQPKNAGLGTATSMAGVSILEQGLDGSVVKGTSHGANQTRCIRQILLLQLELIEQQQQQLDNKNKKIDDLKAEKEMLVARIERMERRLETIKKGNTEVRNTPRRKNTVELVSSERTGQPEEQSQIPQQTNFGRGGKGLKRRFLFQDSPVVKSRRGPPKTSPLKENQAVKGPESQDSTEPEARSHSCSVVELEQLPYMATTEMYLCCWHQPPSSPWQDTSPVEQDMVTVPSWRDSSVEPLEDMKPTDIIECLDDGVFMKRHSKLELDEKRRKRWDIQHIREQRMFQRLQQRMYKRTLIQESEPELLSFYPEAEDVELITITPFLPVVAFGRPLPNLKQQNFEIPWLDERTQSRPDVSKKKTPHRTCRK